MKIIGYREPTDEEIEAQERPVSTALWFDHHGTRCWVVQTLNAAGDQLGEATYVHRKTDALRDQRWRDDNIANWKRT